MAHWICEQCGAGFKRDKSGSRPIRFCDLSCYHTWRKENGITTGQFKTGLAPWNKGVKGIHFSPSTEFKKGLKPATWCKVGTVKIRNTKRDGKQRAWVKVSEPNIWKLRAAIEWEKTYGPLPCGLLVHHRDRNTLNDGISNLEAISRAAHLKDHRPEFEAKRQAALRK